VDEVSAGTMPWGRSCFSRWYRTSSSTFSRCFFDIRPNFTAATQSHQPLALFVSRLVFVFV
jgi:hypothetical protein